MKVSFLTGSISRYSGGLFTSVRRLSQELEPVNVEVLTFKDDYYEEDKVYWQPLKLKTFPYIGPYSLRYSPSLSKYLLDSNPDITHVQALWMYQSRVNLSWAKKNNKPYIITPRGMLDKWAVNHSGWKKKIIGKWFENEHLTKAACIHALCESEAKSIREYGIANTPICIIPNGIDLPIEKEYSVPNNADARILLYIGRIHSKKNLFNLIKAWNNILENNAYTVKDWKLVIAGWGQYEYESELLSIVKELGMGSSVLFLGPLYGEEKEKWLAHAEGFILPSYSEGLPMAILEAWAYKLPVLMSQECNIPEGFTKQAAIDTGTDISSITKSVNSFLTMSSSERKQMGENGYQLVKQKFTWDKIASQTISVYKWIMGSGSKPNSIL